MGLDEEVVFGIELRRAHRALEIKAKPFLDAVHSSALGEIEKQNEIENQRRGENRIAAEEIHLDLHFVAEPSENIDIVPALFVVAARRVIVDADLVIHLAVEIGIQFRLQKIFENAEFGFFFGFERIGIVENFAIAIAEKFVKYQPSRPSWRALKPGARIVFINVWPVLKSLPQTGSSVFGRRVRASREYRP